MSRMGIVGLLLALIVTASFVGCSGSDAPKRKSSTTTESK